MGREKTGVWLHYTPSEANSTWCLCNACKQVFKSPQASRMRQHLVYCKLTSDDIKSEYKLQVAHAKDQLACAKKRTRLMSPPPFTTPQNSQKHPRSARGLHSAKKITQDEFLVDIAFLFHAMSWSFRGVESVVFKWFARKYLPGYSLPTRQLIASDLLDKVYAAQKNEVASVLKNTPELAIATDGWTDALGRYLTNFVIVSQGLRPLFWCSIRAEENQNTGDVIAEKLLEVIRDVEDVTSSKIRAIVSENASNMKKACRILKAQRKDIITYGCDAHSMNLALESVFQIPFLFQVRDRAIKVTKYVKKRAVLLARSRSAQKIQFTGHKGRRTLSLPVLTRWFSTARCISNVFQNKSVLRKLFKDSEVAQIFQGAKFDDVMKLVTPADSFDSVKIVLKLVRPITKAIAELEKDTTCIADVYKQFQVLLKHEAYDQELDVNSSLAAKVIKVIKSRWRVYQAPLHRVAFLLDPHNSYDDFLMSTMVGRRIEMLSVSQKMLGSQAKNF